MRQASLLIWTTSHLELKSQPFMFWTSSAWMSAGSGAAQLRQGPLRVRDDEFVDGGTGRSTCTVRDLAVSPLSRS